MPYTTQLPLALDLHHHLADVEGHYSTMSRLQVFLKQSHKVAAGCSGESLLEETDYAE